MGGMNYYAAAALVAGVLSVVALVPYARGMLRGTTRPNLVTWGLWLLIQSIFVSAQVASGASWSVVLPLTEVATVGVVFALGLFGYGYKKYGRLDFLCLGVALGAIVLWQATAEPMVALVMSVIADLIAALPTVYKAYRDPKSETPSAYLLVVVSAVFAALSTTLYDVPNLLWPAYIFFINSLVLVCIVLGKGSRQK